MCAAWAAPVNPVHVTVHEMLLPSSLSLAVNLPCPATSFGGTSPKPVSRARYVVTSSSLARAVKVISAANAISATAPKVNFPIKFIFIIPSLRQVENLEMSKLPIRIGWLSSWLGERANFTPLRTQRQKESGAVLQICWTRFDLYH